MKKKPRLAHPAWLTIFLIVLVAGLAVMPLPAIAQDPPPDRPGTPGDRPDPPPDRPDPPGTPGDTAGRHDAGDRTAPWTPCATIFGTVTNWGYQNEPGLPVQFSGAGWQTAKITDGNGHYASDCMGIGVGLVNVLTPPHLTPLTTDVALRLGYKAAYEINLGIYSGEAAPPLDLPVLIAGETQVTPGATVSYTITVESSSGDHQPMKDVLITDLLPDELLLTGAISTVGNLERWGNLLTADIGTLEPGQQAVITVSAAVPEDTPPGTVITNRASLIRSGNLVVQTHPVRIEVTGSPVAAPSPASGGNSPLYLPETGAEKSACQKSLIRPTQ